MKKTLPCLLAVSLVVNIALLFTLFGNPSVCNYPPAFATPSAISAAPHTLDPTPIPTSAPTSRPKYPYLRRMFFMGPDDGSPDPFTEFILENPIDNDPVLKDKVGIYVASGMNDYAFAWSNEMEHAYRVLLECADEPYLDEIILSQEGFIQYMMNDRAILRKSFSERHLIDHMDTVGNIHLYDIAMTFYKNRTIDLIDMIWEFGGEYEFIYTPMDPTAP